MSAAAEVGKAVAAGLLYLLTFGRFGTKPGTAGKRAPRGWPDKPSPKDRR